MPTPIRQFAQMSNHLPRLHALGIDTLEQLQAVSQVASPEISAYLGENVDSILAAIPSAAEAIPSAAFETIMRADYPLGVALDSITRPVTAPVFAFAAAPAAGQGANLVAQMPPIRDQGVRGTCVAHAALAAYEHFLNVRGALQDLSEQFLYWNCKRSDGVPEAEGTWLGIGIPALKRDGCCPEAFWPYNPAIVPGSQGQGPPPGGAQLQALSFRIPSFRMLASASVEDYRAELQSGRVVAFSIPVFNSWWRSTAAAFTGEITMPPPGEVRAGGHAMCIVGFLDQPDRPEIGGGRFILRNSWGDRWGLTSPFGTGYGTIPYAYIARFGTEAYCISDN